MTPASTRLSPRIATQLAAVSLALVLLGLAAYAVTMDRRSSGATLQAEQSILIARAYSDIETELLELERIGVTFMFTPTPELRVQFDASVERVLQEFRYLAAIGTPEDQRIVSRIEDRYLPELETVQEFFDALSAGRPYFGSIPAEDTITSLHAELEAPALQQRQISMTALRDLRTWHEQRVWTTAGVFATGLGMIALLMGIMRRSALKIVRTEAALAILRRETVTDSLTGLGNHRGFQEALRTNMPEFSAVALMDLDRFKEVNDLRGHAEGDQLLRQMAALLMARAPQHAYRVGGDEFAILGERDDIEAIVTDIVTEASSVLAGVTVSAGLSTWAPGALDADLEVAQADAALRWAKRDGRNRVVTFASVADRVGGVHSARKSQAVRRIIRERAGIRAVFHPIWGLAGDLRACEALVRIDEHLGLGGPEETFDIANQDGRTFDLDMLCAEVILRASTSLPRGALLFINLSPASIVDRRFSSETLAEMVHGAGRRPDEVVLEVTERATVPVDQLRDRLMMARAVGFRVALDDVGAGNAGLEMLRRIPFDWIKIDRSITAAAPRDPIAKGVMQALLAFAGELRAVVVAEGIEQAEELAVVLNATRTETREPVEVVAQGYLLGHPHPATSAFETPTSLRARAA